MSGEVAAVRSVQHGPTGHDSSATGFTPRQLSRLDDALTLSSRESGLIFSVYVGPFKARDRGHAESLFERLTDDSVLIAVSPEQRKLEIMTGPGSSKRLSNRNCSLAALAMRASFANGDLVGGIVTGLRMMADSAGRA